jgi:hypothetical protein
VKVTTAADLEVVLRAECPGFAELLGTMFALRFTGPVTLHFLNGSPQMVELGRPAIHRFPEHPANKIGASSAKSVDSRATSAPFSSP